MSSKKQAHSKSNKPGKVKFPDLKELHSKIKVPKGSESLRETIIKNRG